MVPSLLSIQEFLSVLISVGTMQQAGISDGSVAKLQELFAYKLICFRAKVFQPVFLHQLLSFSRHNNLFPQALYYHCYSKETQIADFEHLNQLMLGVSHFYWLGDLSSATLSASMKKYIPGFLADYAGPHQLVFFSDTISDQWAEKLLVIDCDVALSPALLVLLTRLQQATFSQEKLSMVYQMAHKMLSPSLDALCMIITYYNLVASKTIAVDAKYIEKLLGEKNHEILSQLLEAFFEKKSKQFYMLWAEVKDDYTPIFWISFWADALWRSYNLVYFMKNQLFREAKKMSFRLPFVLINKLWQQLDLEELARLYQQVYTCDYELKQGLSCESIERLFLNYFSSKTVKEKL